MVVLMSTIALSRKGLGGTGDRVIHLKIESIESFIRISEKTACSIFDHFHVLPHGSVFSDVLPHGSPFFRQIFDDLIFIIFDVLPHGSVF